MKRFLSAHDVDDLPSLLSTALRFKADPYSGEGLGNRKTLGLIFFQPSLRTRMSTQKAARHLGMEVMVMNVGQDAWQLEFSDGAIMNGTASEHVREAAAVLGEYCDIIGVRSFPSLTDRDADYRETVFDAFCRYSNVPVISLESAAHHPLQGFADLMTIEELKTTARPKVVLTWAPHPKALPQAVPNSFAEWMLRANVDLVVTHPRGYELEEQFTTGATIEYDQRKAFAHADFIYAKNWSSYREYGKILSDDSAWRVTMEHMALTNDARFMHCLPVRRNVVVDDAVLDSEHSVVIRQAGNRVWTAQAVLNAMLKAIGEK